MQNFKNKVNRFELMNFNFENYNHHNKRYTKRSYSNVFVLQNIMFKKSNFVNHRNNFFDTSYKRNFVFFKHEQLNVVFNH